MLYLFTWDDTYSLEREIKAWKTKFLSKYQKLDIFHIKNIFEIDNNSLSEMILAISFFWDKKLIILDMDLSWAKKSELSEKQDFLLSLFDKKSEQNIVLIKYSWIDKRSKFYKTIKKIWTIKEFISKKDFELESHLSNKYDWLISREALKLLIRYKSNSLIKIENEISKLLINNDFVDGDLVKQIVFPEFEESIFMIIDDLLNLRKKQAISKIRTILYSSNPYAIYNNLLANLRTSFYISFYKSLSKTKQDTVWELNLWNRAFLYDKNHKISFDSLKKLYTDLIDIDKKMKTWKLLWSDDSDFLFELERVILEF